MPYSSFTLSKASRTFHLETVWQPALFADIEPLVPSSHLTVTLERQLPFALTMGTEKAKSELIIAPVLVEFYLHFESRVSLFSGIDFNVDANEGLTGVCDFLVSLSPQRFDLEAPVIALVEAKNADVKLGVGQCVAEMVAAQRFNADAGNDIRCVYGAATSGMDWLFLKLEGQTLSIDLTVYPIAQCDKILGILASMVSQAA